ncbi:MAG TPA: hypothetical protein VIU44_07780 [Gaiellaceae bacterium]
MQQDPRYSEGFHDAWSGEPLFDGADPIYAAGWRAYWNVRNIFANL